MTPGSPSAAPTAAPTMACVPEVVLEEEDFEGSASTVASEWASGSTADDPGFSEFLGPLGMGSEEMSKTITVPRGYGPVAMEADRVTIEFVLYQIDDWTPDDDKFSVEINGVVIDLGEMDSTSDSTAIGGVESGISWERETPQQGTDLGFGPTQDKKHSVTLIVPASLFPDETISLGFRVTTRQLVSHRI